METMESAALLKETKLKMDKAVEHALREFSTIHTGKASPAMVENVVVEAYGSMMKLKEIAAIMTPDARTISIQPWDKSVTQEIAKAIVKANVGLNPVVDGSQLIRCPIPELSRERRQDLVKNTHGMAERSKVRIRDIRREAMDALKKKQKDGKITEDDLKRFEKDVQHATDNHIEDVEKHLANKEAELMKM